MRSVTILGLENVRENLVNVISSRTLSYRYLHNKSENLGSRKNLGSEVETYVPSENLTSGLRT